MVYACFIGTSKKWMERETVFSDNIGMRNEIRKTDRGSRRFMIVSEALSGMTIRERSAGKASASIRFVGITGRPWISVDICVLPKRIATDTGRFARGLLVCRRSQPPSCSKRDRRIILPVIRRGEW